MQQYLLVWTPTRPCFTLCKNAYISFQHTHLNFVRTNSLDKPNDCHTPSPNSQLLWYNHTKLYHKSGKTDSQATIDPCNHMQTGGAMNSAGQLSPSIAQNLQPKKDQATYWKAKLYLLKRNSPKCTCRPALTTLTLQQQLLLMTWQKLCSAAATPTHNPLRAAHAAVRYRVDT